MNQVGTVSKPLPVRAAVRVLSPKGKPVRGEEVVFSPVSGGGLVSGNSVLTDREGVARVGTWILGTAAGPQTLEARVSDLPPFVFHATAEPDTPADLEAVDGDEQTGVVGAPPAVQPSVRVVDRFGNPVEGAEVAFQVMEGGGSLSGATSETDAVGVAHAPSWILGTTPGANVLSAALASLPPVTFRAMGVPDVPGRLLVLVGDGQSGPVGEPLPFRPTVLVADRFSNLLEGVAVLFEVASGGGNVADGNQVTDAGGAAVSGPWTLGPGAGPQTLQITVSGLDPVVLSATANPGPPRTAIALGFGTQLSTVATAVPDPPAVRVEDAFGNPVPGVGVSFTPSGSPDPLASPGRVEGGETTTGPDGLAASEGWWLGTLAGQYSVTAEVSGLSEGVVFFATAVPGAPSSLAILDGNHQTAAFGQPVPVPPAVRVADAYGNGVPEVPVSFEVVEGDGALSGDQGLTDGQGKAAAGGWILGPQPGENRVEARVDGVGTVVFEAVALAAVPASVEKVQGDQQVAAVGTGVPVPPGVRVTDASGYPVAGMPVAFEVTSGGGAVIHALTETGPDGLATVGGWVLGTLPGSNTLSATAGELSPTVFTATAIPGPPALVEVNDGGGQKVLVGSPLPIPPSVRIADSYGNPTPGETVAFAVSSGGGTVSGPVAVAGPDGVARVGGWTLGPTAGAQRLTASVGGLTREIVATAWPPGGFQIEVEFLTPVEVDQALVFTGAASRWEGIVVGDIPDFGGTLPEGGCQPVTDSGGIDDVKIYVSVKAIDGSGGVLGRAGPCYYRTFGGIFPITGIMELDEADLADMQAAGLLEDVIVHEMGHVLGFGTLWNASSNQFLTGAGGVDPYFNGLGARFAFDAVGGAVRTAPKVPVENTGGAGTRDGHWRESVHNAELMTGWIEGGGTPNPLSIITIASLSDMGYVVDMNAGDPYVLFNPLGMPGQTSGTNRFFIQELPPPEPIPVGGGNTGR